MNYIELTNVVLGIFSGLITLLTAHFIIFSIVGIFAKKTYPKAKTKHKYGIIIPARNEELVIGNLIKSVYKNNYPQDKLHVFVIAHNCNDKTAEISRKLGATVYEYNNKNECTMGYAFKYLFEQIKKDYGTENYDGFFLFNADNILDENYFDKMNDAFDAENCENVITSFRNSKNFGSNVISGMYGMFFMTGCRLESRGRTVCGCSTRVQGTGYVINSKIVENGWKYVTLTEDWEFTADQIIQGNKIKFCDDAVFYDEQPTTTKIMFRQRARWAKGHLLVCLTKTKQLLKNLFSRNKKGQKKINRFSTYDILVNCLPIGIITTALFAINVVMVLLSPIFGVHISYWLEWLKQFGISLLVSYAMLYASGILIFILERKRIKDVSLFKKIIMSFVWPIFMFLSIPIEIFALFSKNIGWKAIPHKDTTTFEKINNKNTSNSELTDTEEE